MDVNRRDIAMATNPVTIIGSISWEMMHMGRINVCQ